MIPTPEQIAKALRHVDKYDPRIEVQTGDIPHLIILAAAYREMVADRDREVKHTNSYITFLHEARELAELLKRQYGELAKQIKIKPTPTRNNSILENMINRHATERKEAGIE